MTLMVHSLPHLTRLVQALLQVSHIHQISVMTNILYLLPIMHTYLKALTLEVRPRCVLTLPTFPSSSLPSLPLHFAHTHFNSDKVAALLKEVCHLLGCRGDLPVLLDYIMDQFHCNPQQQNELLLLLAYLLPGGCHKGCGHGETTPLRVSEEEMYVLVEGMVSTLVSPERLSASHETPSPSNSDHIQNFLLVYVLFTCVHVLGTGSEGLLQLIMYPLMVRLQDDNVGVVSAAMATLQAISHHCNYE